MRVSPIYQLAELMGTSPGMVHKNDRHVGQVARNGEAHRRDDQTAKKLGDHFTVEALQKTSDDYKEKPA